MLGDKIKKIRELKNIDSKNLANKIGITPAYLSLIENGKRKNPSMKILKKIALALNIPLENLLSDSEDMYNTIKISNNEENIEKSMPTIPQKFTDPAAAREYVSKHEIFGANGFRPERMTNEEILDFANALQEQMELLMYKYKK